MEKRQFILSSIPRMAHFTFPYLTSFFGVINNQKGKHLGSGLRCVFEGHNAVITALHVIEDAAREPGGCAISAGYGVPPFSISRPIHFDSAGDLAVCYLPADFPFGNDILFWPQQRIDVSTDRLATDYLFVHGFPAARSQFFDMFHGFANKSLPYGAMQRLENLPPDLKEFEFALDYDPVNIRPDDSRSGLASFVDPHGLSGSPVWRIGISGGTAKHWSPQLSLLVGIVTQWRPHEKILVATLASRVTQLVHQSR
jgi:hypothetical protein